MTSVVVIGAGISGLCAAKLLSENDVNVTVLEARSRVGGRTYTKEDPSYGHTDIGGAYIGPGQRRIARLAKSLGLTFHNVYNKGYTVTDIKSFKARYKGLIPPIYNPIKLLDVNHVIRKLNEMAKLVPGRSPWDTPQAKQWDNMTVQEFLDKTCWTNFAKAVVVLMLKSLLCVEAHQVSLLGLLWYIKNGGCLERLVQVAEGAQELKIVEGAQSVSSRMAALLGERVWLSQPVIRVDQSDDKVVVHTADGKTYQADYVVSAVPQALLNRIQFIPPLPPLKLQLIQNIPMGSIIKTVTFYKKSFWRQKGFNGQLATDKGPIIYCMDDTKPDGSFPAIMGFILADQARELVSLTPEQRKKRICEHYASHFNCDDFLSPVNYVEHNWMAEEYSGGCYVSTFSPGVITSFGKELRAAAGRVYFAGTESATEWLGYMDGAVQAGERAARQILHKLARLELSAVEQEEPEDPEFTDRDIKPLWIERQLPSVGSFLGGLLTLASIVVAVLGVYVHTYMHT